MSWSDFNEIRIVEDDNVVEDVIKEIIVSEKQEDAFHVLNVGELVKRHKLWLHKMPRVVPHFAMKCNSDPTVIKILAKLNANFDCSSKQEIIEVMKQGVSGARIIYANAMKPPSHINFAQKVGVEKLTADCRNELIKIKTLFPEAKVIIRIRCDSANSDVNLGLKFGCDPSLEATELINLSKELGLYLYGFSFHVGSPCGELTAYESGIQICKELIDYARSIGCNETCLIDIGGGFPGETDYDFDELSNVINEAIKDIDPSIKIISEPGRYYVTAAISAAAYLFGKKTVIQDNKKINMYYVNDGTYGSFIEELLKLKARHPSSLNGTIGDKKHLSTLWGPTCDSLDCILNNVFLPDLQVGDWLVWKDMGAYTTSCSTKFNGFHAATIFSFMRRKDWKALQAEILGISNGCIEILNGKGQELHEIVVDQETRETHENAT